MDQEKDMHGPEQNDAEWEAYLDEIMGYEPAMAEAEAAYNERMAA